MSTSILGEVVHDAPRPPAKTPVFYLAVLADNGETPDEIRERVAEALKQAGLPTFGLLFREFQPPIGQDEEYRKMTWWVKTDKAE